MALGAADGDPSMTVLPCALQADKPESWSNDGNYVGNRLTWDNTRNIDALNYHAWSYAFMDDGQREAVQPEQSYSSLRGLFNMMRFRDANLPGMPIFVTEFGWDSDGGGEDCEFEECVSERAQALYAVRGTLFLARLGVGRISWFFFANSDCDSLYCRSGLYGSQEGTGFTPKASSRALESLVNLLGDTRFLGVAREDSQAWVYVVGNDAGVPTHVVAWRPIEAEDSSSVEITMPLPWTPGQAWRILGTLEGNRAVTSPVLENSRWRMELSGEPLVVALEH